VRWITPSGGSIVHPLWAVHTFKHPALPEVMTSAGCHLWCASGWMHFRPTNQPMPVSWNANYISHTTSHFPDTFDGVKFRAVKRHEFKCSMFPTLFPLFAMQTSMVLFDIVQDHTVTIVM
jgi:hypothetical protein